MAQHSPVSEARVGNVVFGMIESVLLYTDFEAANVTDTVSLPALPANSIPVRCKANVGRYFTGGSITTAVLDVGDAGDPDGWLDSLTVFDTTTGWAGVPGIEADYLTPAAATVGADIAAFTDPPSAAEMATLRTFVNALKADVAAIRGQRGPVQESAYTAIATLTCSHNCSTLTAGMVTIRQYYLRYEDK